MNWLKATGLTLVLSLLFLGCNGTPAWRDFYTEAIQEGRCNFFVSKIDELYFETTTPLDDHEMGESCAQYFENTLPFDETFDNPDNLPSHFKQKVFEAFQFFIGYPILISPNRSILGVHASPGTIPLIPTELTCTLAGQAFTESECPIRRKLDQAYPELAGKKVPIEEIDINRNVFNFVLNSINKISYRKVGDSVKASFYPTRDQIYLTNRWWDPDRGSYTAPYIRALNLFHETRHGTFNFHSFCRWGGDDCDPDMNGPYGYQGVLGELWLRGIAQPIDMDDPKRPHGLVHIGPGSPSERIASALDVGILGHSICENLNYRVNHIADDLKDVFGGNCAHNANWYMDRLGLQLFTLEELLETTYLEFEEDLFDDLATLESQPIPDFELLRHGCSIDVLNLNDKK